MSVGYLGYVRGVFGQNQGLFGVSSGYVLAKTGVVQGVFRVGDPSARVPASNSGYRKDTDRPQVGYIWVTERLHFQPLVHRKVT